jgi:CRISPR/Cas system-associated endoribonuclease Cas2
MVTLDEALDTVAQLSTEEQMLLLTIVKNRRRGQWRDELAQYVQEVQTAVQRGELRPQSAEEVVNDLRTLSKQDGDGR